eukprot:5297134-Pyramimonas_sp.AAC.2
MVGAPDAGYMSPKECLFPQAAAVKPHQKHVKKLRALLADNFGRSQVHWKDNEDAPPGSEEAYPYVSFTLPLQ